MLTEINEQIANYFVTFCCTKQIYITNPLLKLATQLRKRYLYKSRSQRQN